VNPPEFIGTVVLTSGMSRVEAVGTDQGLCVRFASVRDLRTFSRQASSARWLVNLLPAGSIVRVEVAGREIARLGGDRAPRWSAAGLAARLTRLPVSGIRPLWWVGR
jgi:hypothetical protein